jgi:hypothetical protein
VSRCVSLEPDTEPERKRRAVREAVIVDITFPNPLGGRVMTDLKPMLDEDDGPEPPEIVERRALYEEYHRRFGEEVPLMCVDPDPMEEIRAALKTGRPIEMHIPPGAVA